MSSTRQDRLQSNIIEPSGHSYIKIHFLNPTSLAKPGAVQLLQTELVQGNIGIALIAESWFPRFIMIVSYRFLTILYLGETDSNEKEVVSVHMCEMTFPFVYEHIITMNV